MAKIICEIDTDTKTAKISKDGQEISLPVFFNATVYESIDYSDYSRINKVCVSYTQEDSDGLVVTKCADFVIDDDNDSVSASEFIAPKSLKDDITKAIANAKASDFLAKVLAKKK